MAAAAGAREKAEAALGRPFATVCAWCQENVVRVAHPESTGICAACLESLYPEAP